MNENNEKEEFPTKIKTKMEIYCLHLRKKLSDNDSLAKHLSPLPWHCGSP